MLTDRWLNNLQTTPPRRLWSLLSIAVIVSVLAFPVVMPSLSWAQDAGPQPVEELASENPTDVESANPTRKGINFLTLLTRGGWFMIPLGLLSVIVVTISIERFLALRRDKIFPSEVIDQLAQMSMNQGGLDPRQAYQVCQQYPSSASQVLRSMLIKVGRPQAEIENAVSESSQREATRLSQIGSWLSLAAAIAPLIGLLGTVWGITQAFYDTTQMVEGANRSEALAQGIYTALVTTMCGLMIAIPAAILSHHFDNRIITLMNEIEEMIFNLMPQVERYEGKLRFAASGTNGATSNDPASLAKELAGESARDASMGDRPSKSVSS